MANRIREIRKKKKLTLQQVSNATGISVSSLSAYEKQENNKGYRNPKIENWQKLANFFDVSVSYLQGISNVKNPVLNDVKVWLDQIGIDPSDPVVDEKKKKIMDRETPAFFNEINIYEYTLLKKAIFNKVRGNSLKEYKELADSVSSSRKMADILEFTRGSFEIALKGLNGDEKAKDCYEKIYKIISHYFGYDKFKL